MANAVRNLEQKLNGAKSIPDVLRNSQIGAYVYPVVPDGIHELARRAAGLAGDGRSLRPIAPHGRTPGRRAGCHQASFAISAINSFASFAPNKAKQFVTCSPDGHVIGDVILFHLDREPIPPRRPRADGQLGAVPRPNRRIRRNDGAGRQVALSPRRQAGDPQALPLPGAGTERTAGPRKAQRRTGAGHQVLQHGRDHHRRSQGPRPAARDVRRPRASRSGGPMTRATRSARRFVEAGKDFGLHQVGARAYATNTLESGWIPSPLPAVYTGEQMKSYREWLPSDSYEASGSHRRQLLFRPHRGLLPDAIRARLWLVREVRSRLHRAARRWKRLPASRIAGR